MNYQKIKLAFFFIFFLTLISCEENDQKNRIETDKNMMIRMAEIEIDSAYTDEYNSILKEEAEASIRLESGVLAIFPMFQKENPTQLRLLEIYANKYSYQKHLETPHFKRYKSTTSKMIKSLNLIEMGAIDEETMNKIFVKIER